MSAATPCPSCSSGSGRKGQCICPLVCDCLVAQPEGWFGQCRRCKRRISSLMSIDHYQAAIATYPELAGQTVKAMP